MFVQIHNVSDGITMGFPAAIRVNLANHALMAVDFAF